MGAENLGRPPRSLVSTEQDESPAKQFADDAHLGRFQNSGHSGLVLGLADEQHAHFEGDVRV